MKRLLIRFAGWILRHYGIPLFLLSAEIISLRDSAVKLCDKIDIQDQSGEWKRHQVYAKLIKMYPRASRRDIALAIELALR